MNFPFRIIRLIIAGLLLMLLALGLNRQHTNPTVATGAREVPLRFAVIGDYGMAGQAEADVAALVKGWSPEFIATTGDNNYDTGSATTIDANIGQYYHDYIAPYTGGYGSGAAANRFFPTLGNHDWASPTGAQPYLDYFSLPNNERYYTIVRGPVQLFMIDSDPNEPDGNTSASVQAQWLQAQLAASTAPWKLVLMHHAPYSSSAGHGSQPVAQWPYAQWGASAVIAGHDHTYERIISNEFPYFVNGLGGRSLYGFSATPVTGSVVRYNLDYGAMLIEAIDSSITFKFITRTGIEIDTYTINNPPIVFTDRLYMPQIQR
jgi:hypothetical protein